MLLMYIKIQFLGGPVVKVLICEIGDHMFDTHRCTSSKWNGQSLWLNLANKENGDISVPSHKILMMLPPSP